MSSIEDLTKKTNSVNSSRIPSLDGIRAISILLVLVGHLSGGQGFGKLDFGVGDYARLGVKIFFVISGYLITTLLAKEEAKNGSISLKFFYLRRTIRIFPAAYGYLLFLLVVQSYGLIQLKPWDYFCALTYTTNYCLDNAWQVGHLWSLSVEEQFYLVWPVCFYFFGSKKAVNIALAGVLMGPVARLISWYFLRGTVISQMNPLPMMADGLALGCLLAIKESWLIQQCWYKWLTRPLPTLAQLGAILTLNRYMDYSVVSVFGTFIANVFTAILIHRCILNPNDLLGRVLNSRIFIQVGVLSYSLYVWQQFFLNRDSSAWINTFPQNLACAVAMALLSHWLLEMPLLSLRHRIRP